MQNKRAVKRRLVARGNPVQHVIPLGNGWVVKSADTTKFTAITDSKKEAVAIATHIAKTKHTDLVVHDKNGTIREHISYAVAG